jgi:hypothetical protein
MQARTLGNSGQHARTDLYVVVKREHEIGPFGARERAMGASLALTTHPILKRAANTRRARVLGHAVMQR